METNNDDLPETDNSKELLNVASNFKTEKELKMFQDMNNGSRFNLTGSGSTSPHYLASIKFDSKDKKGFETSLQLNRESDIDLESTTKRRIGINEKLL